MIQENPFDQAHSGGFVYPDAHDPNFLKGKSVKGAIGGAVSFVPEQHAEFSAIFCGEKPQKNINDIL